MKRSVNLMTDAARFRCAARVSLRRWAVALAAAGTLMAPISIWHWQQCRRVRHQHEALEASYEPIRRLNLVNMQLRTTATELVRDERLTLLLARQRPVSTPLGVISAAVAKTDGALFVEHLQFTQTPPGADGAGKVPDRLVIDVACTLKYDIANFVEALKAPPFTAVKIASDELVTENGVDRKNYTVECALGEAAPSSIPAQTAHVR